MRSVSQNEDEGNLEALPVGATADCDSSEANAGIRSSREAILPPPVESRRPFNPPASIEDQHSVSQATSPDVSFLHQNWPTDGSIPGQTPIPRQHIHDDVHSPIDGRGYLHGGAQVARRSVGGPSIRMIPQTEFRR